MEDETGIANIIVTPDLFERQRLLITRSKFLLVEGILQNQDDVIYVKAVRLAALSHAALAMARMTFTELKNGQGALASNLCALTHQPTGRREV